MPYRTSTTAGRKLLMSPARDWSCEPRRAVVGCDEVPTTHGFREWLNGHPQGSHERGPTVAAGVGGRCAFWRPPAYHHRILATASSSMQTAFHEPA